MAMVGVVSGSLYRRTHSLSSLAWSWVSGRLAPFYIHQMNRVNSRNGSADDSTINIVVLIIIIIIIFGSPSGSHGAIATKMLHAVFRTDLRPCVIFQPNLFGSFGGDG